MNGESYERGRGEGKGQAKKIARHRSNMTTSSKNPVLSTSSTAANLSIGVDNTKGARGATGCVTSKREHEQLR